MNIVEVTNRSSAGEIADLCEVMASQMAWLSTYLDEKQVGTAVLDALRPSSLAHFLMACCENGDLAGACLFNVCSGIQSGGDYIWINEIHVLASSRRQGVAIELLSAVMAWGKKHGCRRVAASVDGGNIASRWLFRKAGFEENEVVWLSVGL